eukprot:1260681-Amphidinium_carterae.1
MVLKPGQNWSDLMWLLHIGFYFCLGSGECHVALHHAVAADTEVGLSVNECCPHTGFSPLQAHA